MWFIVVIGALSTTWAREPRVGADEPVCEGGAAGYSVFVRDTASILHLCAQLEIADWVEGWVQLTLSSFDPASAEWTTRSRVTLLPDQYDLVLLAGSLKAWAAASTPAFTVPISRHNVLRLGPEGLIIAQTPFPVGPLSPVAISFAEWPDATGEVCTLHRIWANAPLRLACGDEIEVVSSGGRLAVQAVIGPPERKLVFYGDMLWGDPVIVPTGAYAQYVAIREAGTWSTRQLDQRFHQVFESGTGEIWAIGVPDRDRRPWYGNRVLYKLDPTTFEAVAHAKWRSLVDEVATVPGSERFFVVSETWKRRWEDGHRLEYAEMGSEGRRVFATRRVRDPIRWRNLLVPPFIHGNLRPWMLELQSAAWLPDGQVCATVAFRSEHEDPWAPRFEGNVWMACVDPDAP